MSQDYPDYEQIRKVSRWLAFLWMLGDRLYYIGLLGVIFIICGAPVSWVFSTLAHRQVGPNLFNTAGLVLLLSCVALYFMGPVFKRYAREQARIA